MVAISLYRGNLHRVPPEIPRRWLSPRPSISVKDFRRLLSRRSKALSLLPSSSSAAVTTTTTTPPNPNPNFKVPDTVPNNFDPKLDGGGDRIENSSAADPPTAAAAVEEKGKEIVVVPVSTPTPTLNPNPVAVDNPLSSNLQANDKGDTVDEKEKRKTEVEEKLHILNEKKHNLVQALKQILNAEEELKRRSSMQAGRPPLPILVDGSNDSGSMTRHNTPRTGSDANIIGELVGEGDDALNNFPQTRQLLRMNSTSPSAESALRRAPYFSHNVGSHPSRAALVAAGSPSRFAPSGNQGHPTNLPTVSVSGTNYLPSSPSPAASGGTSVFRDARHPSPWN